MVGAGHAAYTDRFHELARLVPHLVTPENKRIERNGSLKKNTEKRGNGREPRRSTRARHPNAQTATITIYPRRIVVRVRTAIALGTLPRIAGQHIPRLNRAPRQGGNGPNQVLAVDGGHDHGNNGNDDSWRMI
ncbi:hypothetical protein Tco_1131190 [Tanacetum coccineum]